MDNIKILTGVRLGLCLKDYGTIRYSEQRFRRVAGEDGVGRNVVGSRMGSKPSGPPNIPPTTFYATAEVIATI